MGSAPKVPCHKEEKQRRSCKTVLARGPVSRRLTSSRTHSHTHPSSVWDTPWPSAASWLASPGMIEGAIGWRSIGSHHPQDAFPVEKLSFREAASRAGRPSCAPGTANPLDRGPVPQPLLETSGEFLGAKRHGGGATERKPGAAVDVRLTQVAIGWGYVARTSADASDWTCL